jgi:hypothetical protein
LRGEYAAGLSLRVPPSRKHFGHCYSADFPYIYVMNRLTKQEQMVVCIVLGLLLTGWAVKAYRTAHPPVRIESQDSSRDGNSPIVTVKQAER